MKKFVITHIHSDGVDVHPIECNSTGKGILENIHSVFEMLGVTYYDEEWDDVIVKEIPEELKTLVL